MYPAVLCELGYHDNVEDVTWLKNNLEGIAANLVESLCDFLKGFCHTIPAESFHYLMCFYINPIRTECAGAFQVSKQQKKQGFQSKGLVIIMVCVFLNNGGQDTLSMQIPAQREEDIILPILSVSAEERGNQIVGQVKIF